MNDYDVQMKFFSLDLVQDLLRNSAEKQASPASTAFAPPPWAVSKGFAHPTQTQLVLQAILWNTTSKVGYIIKLLHLAKEHELFALTPV